MNLYNTRIIAAERVGFEIYCDTVNEEGVPGTILTNTNRNSPYNGECIDLFDNGTFTQYCQFPGQQPTYQIK